jgi:hypothetical protein
VHLFSERFARLGGRLQQPQQQCIAALVVVASLVTHTGEHTHHDENAGKSMEELANEFHLLAGQCVSQWAITDAVLFQLCHQILGRAVEISAIVYFRNQTLGARLSLVTDLIGSIIPKPKGTGKHRRAGNLVAHKKKAHTGRVSNRNCSETGRRYAVRWLCWELGGLFLRRFAPASIIGGIAMWSRQKIGL